MDELEYLSMAEAYANIQAADYKRKLYSQSTIMAAAEASGPPISILGTITVAYITFLVKMIVNFVKYILWTIKYLIVDSGLLQGVIKGLMGLFGESVRVGVSNGVVTAVDMREIRDKMKELITDVNKRSHKLSTDYKSNIKTDVLQKVFKMMHYDLPTDVRDFSERRIIEYTNNENELERDLQKVRLKYNNINDANKPEKIQFTKSVKLSSAVDIRDYCKETKESIIILNDEVYQPYIAYYQEVNKYCDELTKRTKILADHPELLSDLGEHVAIKYLETILPLFITDIKQTMDKINVFKDLLVSTLAMISDKLLRR